MIRKNRVRMGGRVAISTAIGAVGLVQAAAAFGQTSYTWQPTGAGVWSNPANWSPAGVPANPGDSAFIVSNIGAASAVDLDVSATLGGLSILDDTHQWSLTRSGSAVLTFQPTSGNASIDFLTGATQAQNVNHNIAVPIILNSSLDISSFFSPTTGNSFAATVSGAIFGDASRTIRLLSPGTGSGGNSQLALTSPLHNFLGTIQLQTPASGAGTPAGQYVIDTVVDNDVTLAGNVVLRFNENARLRGMTTLPDAPVWLSPASNAAQSLFHVGRLVGGGSNSIVTTFQEGQMVLDGDNTGWTGTLSMVNGSMVVTDADSLGAPGSRVRWTAGNLNGNVNVSAVLRVANDITTGNSFELAMNNNGRMNFLVDRGRTLTLTADRQIGRASGFTTLNGVVQFYGDGTVRFAQNATMGTMAEPPNPGGLGTIFVSGGTLHLDNRDVNITDRIPAPQAEPPVEVFVNMRKGTILLDGNSSADSSETLGNLTFQRGHNRIISQNGTGRSATLTFGTLARTGTTNGAGNLFGTSGTADFDPGSGSALGGADNRILFINAPALTNNVVGLWARTGSEWATYDTTAGIQALPVYDATSINASAASTDNVKVTAGETLSGPKEIYSLNVQGGAVGIDLAGQNLTIGGGGIGGILNSASAGTISNGTLSLGGGNAELIVHSNGALTIDAAVPAAALTKAGAGALTLTDAAGQQTRTVINEGELVVTSAAQLGTPATVFGAAPTGYTSISGGTLRAAASMNLGQAVVLGGLNAPAGATGLFFSAGEFPYANSIEVDGGSTLTLSGKLTGGPGPGLLALIKTGDGALVLANAGSQALSGQYGLQAGGELNGNEFVGNIRVEAGTLSFSSPVNHLGNTGGRAFQTSGNDIQLDGPTAVLDYSGAGPWNMDSRSIFVGPGGGALNFSSAAVVDLNINTTGKIVEAGASLRMRGNMNVIQNNLDSIRLAHPASDYVGTTEVRAGTIFVGASSPDGAPGALGSGTSSIIVGSTARTDGSNAALLIDTAGVDVGRSIEVNDNRGGTPNTVTLGGSFDTGAATFSGASLNANRPLHVTAAGSSTVAFTGDFSSGSELRKVGSGTVQMKHARAGDLAVDTGELEISAKPAANDPSGTSVVTALSIASGAKLDLTNNSMVINYTGPIGTQLTDVRLHLLNNRLDSSLESTANGIGYLDNGTRVPPLATFAGQAVDNDSILIMYTRLGDADLSGTTDIGDFALLASNFNNAAVWASGDFNYDGIADIGDFALLASNFNGSVASDLPRAAAVPEPASAGLGLLGVAALIARHRRRS